MQPVLNVEDVRHVEQALTREGVSLAELMRRAGAAAAQEVAQIDGAKRVVVLAGFGNNGGDGWVAAERLMSQGYDVLVITPVEPEEVRSDLAHVVAVAAQRAGVPIAVAPPREQVEELLEDADVVLDAMLGTGFRGEPKAPFDIWISCLNASGARVVAVDVPSGLSAQTGRASGEVVLADETITMMTEPEHGTIAYHGMIPNLDLGPDLVWNIGPGSVVSEQVEAIRDTWKQYIEDANK